MCVALIGGMNRSERNYISKAERLGIDLKVYTKSETGMTSKIRSVDAVVIFTKLIKVNDSRIAMGRGIAMKMVVKRLIGDRLKVKASRLWQLRGGIIACLRLNRKRNSCWNDDR